MTPTIISTLRKVTTAATILLALVATHDLAAQSKGSALGPEGTVWGGTHLELEVTSQVATLEFDCASGTIVLPLTADSHGVFTAKGTFTREHPGPVMRDNPNSTAPAVFTGTITGDILHLKVSAGSPPENLGEFVLTRGQPGRIFKCK